jgi:hypothetical protein
MKSKMNFLKFSKSLNLSREKLRPYMEAGIIDPWSESDLEKILNRQAELLDMEEIPLRLMDDPITQLAHLSSDDMPFMSKWQSIKAGAALLGIHHATAMKMVLSGEIPHFKTPVGQAFTTMQSLVKIIENKKAGIVFKPEPKLEAPAVPIQTPAPPPASFADKDKDEAWDAGIGKKREELAKAKAFSKDVVVPEVKVKAKPSPILVDDDEDDYVPPSPEQEAETLRMLQARARAGYEEAEIARSKAEAAALALLTPEELEAKKKADAIAQAERVRSFMNKPRS